MGNRGGLRAQLTIRLSKKDLERLKQLAERIPIASRNAVARAALRLGIRVLEANPERAMDDVSPQRRKGSS